MWARNLTPRPAVGLDLPGSRARPHEKGRYYIQRLASLAVWHGPAVLRPEAALRALVIFIVMLLIVRWLGRRMKGQLSISELAIILTLGAIIAGPLHLPAGGLLPSVAVLLTVLAVHRLSNWLAFKYRPAELVQQGDVALLVRDGCLELETLQQPRAVAGAVVRDAAQREDCPARRVAPRLLRSQRPPQLSISCPSRSPA
ncbi:MAG: hypothetical protein WKG07_04665 [Hymenobacter sp.]